MYLEEVGAGIREVALRSRHAALPLMLKMSDPFGGGRGSLFDSLRLCDLCVLKMPLDCGAPLAALRSSW